LRRGIVRPQLLAGGVLVAAMGAGFLILEIPIVDVWSIPFVIGGAIMVVVSFFVPESAGPPQPPEGSRFCVFCMTPVPLASDRCPHCNGLQPKGA